MLIRFKLFWKESVLFGLTLLMGIFSAYHYRFMPQSVTEPKQIFSWSSIIVFLAMFALLSLILLKFKRLGAVSLRFFLLLVVFSGSQAIFASVFPSPFDLVFALATVFIFIYGKNVMIHDLAVALGIAGIGSVVGVTLSPQMVIFLLVILSFYDIISVYWTKHMVYLAKGMVESGAIFGFIIPFEFKDFFYHSGEAQQMVGEKFMILGSGDIGLPLIMVSSVAMTSISRAMFVSVFVLLGLFVTHLIFINQKERKPMAALPPIATLTIIGYLLSQLV